MTPKRIHIDRCEIAGCQSRTETDEDVIEEYRAAIDAGVKFPPIDVFTRRGEPYWVGDGIHRYLAYLRAERKLIDAIVREGGQREAQLHAAAANQSHGLRRTNADKRKAVGIVLDLEPQWSDRMIAEHCGVSATTVGKVRGQLSNLDSCEVAGERVGRDGKRRKPPEYSDSSDPAEFDEEDLDPDFDVAGFDAAPPKKPARSGAPEVSVKSRKKALSAVGALVRALDEVGIADEFDASLRQIMARLKQI